jgi:hypothetical protein
MFLRPNLTVRPADHQAFADISIRQVQSGHMRVVPSNPPSKEVVRLWDQTRRPASQGNGV